MKRIIWLWSGGIIGACVAIYLGLWTWVALSAQPLHNPIATVVPLPVACTARGCVTTTTWVKQQHIAVKYAQSFQQEPPTEATTLTTIIRQKLVSDATLKSSVTTADAQKYRQEILHLNDEAAIRERTGLTGSEYDTTVVLPFLQQEALRQQRRAETSDDLYQQLAAERWVIIPLRVFHWDKNTGHVVSR